MSTSSGAVTAREVELEINLTNRQLVTWKNPSLFISAKSLKITGFETTDVGIILSHQGLKTLILQNGHWRVPADIWKLAVPKVENLRISDVSLYLYSDELFKLFNELREFVYFRPDTDFMSEFASLGDALRQHEKELEHLELHNESLMPIDDHIGSLTPLVKLRKLECYLEYLIGYLPNPVDRGYQEYEGAPWDPEVDEPIDCNAEYMARGNWSFVDVLPTSIEWLCIDIEEPKMHEYYNTWNRYGNKFFELATTFENIKFIRAPHLDVVAQRLQNANTNWILYDGALVRP